MSGALSRRATLAALAAGAILPGCVRVGGDGPIALRLAHTLNADHPVHKAMVFMGEQLAELSSGSMSLQIYPNGQLGSERELVELLQIGAVAITKVSTISMEGFSSSMKLFSVPYLFSDSDHLWRVLESDIGQELLDSLRAVRLQGLGYYDAGARSFYMTDNPGVVDGAENNPPSYYLSRHYEAAKYYTLDEHTAVPDLLVMSRAVYDKLPDQESAWLKTAMAASVVEQRKLWADSTEEAYREVQKAGVEIIRPDKQPFRDAVAPMKAAFLETDLGPLIERVGRLDVTS